MGASWTFYLDDANGSALCELSTADGRSLSFRRNTYSEATFTIGMEDDAASLLTGALAATGVPTLRAYRRSATASAGVLRFRGYLAAVQGQAEESALMTCTFRSPFGRLIGNGSDTGRFLSAAQQYAATDAGDIALQLIELANAQGATGLSTSLERARQIAHPPLPAEFNYTKARDRNYPVGTNIGQAVFNLSSVLDGYDFFETFVEGTGGVMAQFNIATRQGIDVSNARFEYGPGTLGNIRSVDYLTLPPVNQVTVLGANGLAGTRNDVTSQGKYGLWPQQQSASDVIEQANLDDKAWALLRPSPIKTIAFTPEPGLCPQFFEDFGLGDTVRFFARRGGMREEASLRVNGMTMVIDSDGNEASEIDDPTTPEADAVTRALLSVEVTE